MWASLSSLVGVTLPLFYRQGLVVAKDRTALVWPKPNIRVTSRKVALKRDMAIAMTNRVLCNGVTVSDIKSMHGLVVNTLPNSLNPMWH